MRWGILTNYLFKYVCACRLLRQSYGGLWRSSGFLGDTEPFHPEGNGLHQKGVCVCVRACLLFKRTLWNLLFPRGSQCQSVIYRPISDHICHFWIASSPSWRQDCDHNWLLWHLVFGCFHGNFSAHHEGPGFSLPYQLYLFLSFPHSGTHFPHLLSHS